MQTVQYFVGDAPSLQFQLVEPASEGFDNVATNPDITGWTAILVMAPLTAGVRRVNATCSIVDAGAAVFGFDVPGGLLPGQTPPLVAPIGSFSKPATYTCRLIVQTHNPDSSPGEVLTSEAFSLIINPRE